jgi:ankyrin repeat protein
VTVGGKRIATDESASVTASGLADGDVVQLVEDKTALKGGATYLYAAAQAGEKEAVRVLVEAADESVDAKTNFKWTALHAAAGKGHGGVVEDLVAVAADCHAVANGGYTPLDRAADGGDEGAAEQLVCGGADVDAADGSSFRPLHCAALYGKEAVGCELVEGGAAVAVKDRFGSQPLERAVSGVREVLEAAGAVAR